MGIQGDEVRVYSERLGYFIAISILLMASALRERQGHGAVRVDQLGRKGWRKHDGIF